MKQLAGEKHGCWTVLKFSKKKKSNYWWTCRCDCGAVKDVLVCSLLNQPSKNCRQCRYDDLTGQTLNNYTVKARLGRDEKGNRLYACCCQCGKEKTMTGSQLLRTKAGGHCRACPPRDTSGRSP